MLRSHYVYVLSLVMQGVTLENAHGQDNGVKGATRPTLRGYLAHAIISLVVLKEGDNT